MNKIPMRDGYGKALLKLTQENKKDIYFALSEVLPKEETLHMACLLYTSKSSGDVSWKGYGLEEADLSGGRVRNAWVTCPIQGDNV